MEIDLTTHFVIPLPVGMTLDQLATISAEFSNFTETIQTITEKVFTGSEAEFKVATENKIVQTISISETEIIYNEMEIVPSPLTIVEFGKSKAVKVVGDYFRQIMTWKNTQQIEIKKAELAEFERKTKEKITNQLEAMVGNIKAL